MTMTGKYIEVDGGDMFVRLPRRAGFDRDQPSVLFIHGLGESGACYAEALQWLQDQTLIIPDLPGYGHSKPATNNDHSTETQARRILQLIEILKLDKVTLVGHSWGGDVGTIICTLGKENISQYISVEGDLHGDNVFISQIASQAYRTMTADDFKIWLWRKGFPEFVLGWNYPAALRYLSSVRSCDPRVFGQTATEIVRQCETADPNGILQWGHLFAQLPVPKIYCWGSLSIQHDSQVITFLDDNRVEHKCFANATHWVMEDRPEHFYTFLKNRIMQA